MNKVAHENLEKIAADWKDFLVPAGTGILTYLLGRGLGMGQLGSILLGGAGALGGHYARKNWNNWFGDVDTDQTKKVEKLDPAQLRRAVPQQPGTKKEIPLLNVPKYVPKFDWREPFEEQARKGRQPSAPQVNPNNMGV